MTCFPLTRALACGALLAGASCGALAQAEGSAYGVADFSYGRFEPSGFVRTHRFNSNSMTASFVGLNGKYGLDGGWTPGVTLETFIRFQDFRTGRSDNDPRLSRNVFISLASPYGTVSAGRLQTLLFNTVTRLNALGNSVAFSPAIRHVFVSGNLESVEGDFYWNRAVSYVSPPVQGVTVSAMYGEGPSDKRGDLAALNAVISRGLFAAALSWQKVRVNLDLEDPTRENTWQLGSTYNLGWARVYGLWTETRDDGFGVRSRSASAGVAVPLGPGELLLQAGRTRADGVAADRLHTSYSGAYVYKFDSLTDIYVVGMNDEVRGQTGGVSVASGVRYRFKAF